jgi:phytanoyl-CoA hydroxylase
MPKITVPLRAGDCTFHHGRCPHMANANSTGEYRVAHVAIYIDRDTLFDPDVPGHANKHVVTDPLQLTPGTPLDGEYFPEI